MGICCSCESTSVATAKLILEDGLLEEFCYPVRVSQILQKNPRSFICNADDMGFDDYVLAINDDEHIQIGQLYFELPLSWLNNPLTSQQMAALAMKASLALKMGHRGAGCSLCWARRKDRLGFVSERVSDEASPMVVIGGVGGGSGGGFVAKRRVRCGDGGGGGSRERRTTTKLSVILEEREEGIMCGAMVN